MTELRIRSSELNRLAKCPASKVQSVGLADPRGREGVVGSTYHEVMANAARIGIRRATEEVPQYATTHGIEPEEIQSLLTKFKFDPEGGEPEVRVDWALEGTEITVSGIADLLLQHNEHHIEVVDYKTTWMTQDEPDPWAHLQMMSYGVGAWEKIGFDKSGDRDAKVTLSLAFPRLGDERGWSQWEMNALDVNAARGMIREVAVRAAEQFKHDEARRDYQPGDHCRWCAGRATCPGLAADLRMAMKVADVVDIDKENAADLFMLRSMMSRCEKAIKDRVRELVRIWGPIEVDDDRQIEVREFPVTPGLRANHIKDALRQCGVDAERTKAVMLTLELRQKVQSSRLGVYRKTPR